MAKKISAAKVRSGVAKMNAALAQKALEHTSQRCGAEPGMCMLCEDNPATLRVTVTTPEGEVLDYAAFCRYCAMEPLDSLGLNPGKAQQIVAAKKVAKRIAKLAPRRKGARLTPMQRQVLQLVYQQADDCSGGDFAILGELPRYYRKLGFTEQQFGGVITSLQAAGLITVHAAHEVNGGTEYAEKLQQITFDTEEIALILSE